MENFRFFNRYLPQTLLVAVYLLYINVVFDVIFGAVRNPIVLVITAGFAVGALGIVNERRFGYYVALVASALNVLWVLLLVLNGNLAFILNLLFSGALFVLLIHPMSRQHQRYWFK